MKIVLFDLSESVVSALGSVQGAVARIANLAYVAGVDAVAVPCASLGFIDGNVDDVLGSRWPGVKERVALEIRDEWHGELPVGCAVSVETLDPRLPWLIAAPTMRVPMRLPDDTVAPYLASRAAAIEAKRLGLRSLAMTGMGTGAGAVPASQAAHQMDRGIKAALAPPPLWGNWLSAASDHRTMIGLAAGERS